MTKILAGKSIVITGAFGSLGTAVAEAALEAGATIAAVDRLEQARTVTFTTGIRAWGGVDLGNSAAAEAVFKSIADAFGAIDALVNVAGGFRWETFADGNIETWDLLYNINLRTALSATKSALPHLLKRGCDRGARIVNIGAAAAANAGRGMGAYAASKSGVSRFTESLAAELKDSGITVNAILPGIIDTPSNRADRPNADFARWVTSQQVADVIVFLLSSRSSAINGASIPLMGRV
jgi:NAD(P)-dependent dehydrogenase (short-subunit alcohol dehydrogenase family)